MSHAKYEGIGEEEEGIWRRRCRGVRKAKLIVTLSKHVLVNMANFGDDLEIEGDILAVKRSHDDDDTSGGASDGTSGTSASTERMQVMCPRSGDAEELTTNQDHRERRRHLRSFS